jgi:hypothetical protein
MALLVGVVMLGRFVEQAGQGRDVRGGVLPLAARKPRLDLLEQPSVAVRVAERGIRLVGAAFRIGAQNTAARQVEDLADLDAPANEVGSRRVDVVDGQQQALNRPGLVGGEALAECDRAARVGGVSWTARKASPTTMSASSRHPRLW